MGVGFSSLAKRTNEQVVPALSSSLCVPGVFSELILDGFMICFLD